MRCPHCGKSVRVPPVAREHTETYGSNCFTFTHRPCGNKISIVFRRIVSVVKDSIEKTDNDTSWSGDNEYAE